MNAILTLLKPYSRISLQFMSKELNISKEEVEELLVGLILDERIAGSVDQIQQVLVIFRQEREAMCAGRISHWCNELQRAHQAVLRKVSNM